MRGFIFCDFRLEAAENCRLCPPEAVTSVTFPNRRGATCGKRHHPAGIAPHGDVGQGGLTMCGMLDHPTGLTE